MNERIPFHCILFKFILYGDKIFKISRAVIGDGYEIKAPFFDEVIGILNGKI